MAPLKVGVLLVGSEVQFLDVSAVDILAMSCSEYLKAAQIPEAVYSRGQSLEFLYITEKGRGLYTVTGGLKVQATHGLDNTGQLDYLLIPGPKPTYQATPAEKDFVHSQLPGLKYVFGICTGTFILAQAGILDGLTATGPRTLLPLLKQMAPKTNWTEKRWEVDSSGKVWTSGGVTNGQDALAAFIRTTYARDVAELVCTMADVGDRGQFYPEQTQA